MNPGMEIRKEIQDRLSLEVQGMHLICDGGDMLIALGLKFPVHLAVSRGATSQIESAVLDSLIK